jgi:hypothetical protein
MAVSVSGATVVIVCATNPETMLHWFVIPVLFSGVLIGVDFFAWFRGRMDLFDPVGLVGAYGYYFFFVAPLLTVMWKYHTPGLAEPPGWRDWMGAMAILNCAGLMVYLIVRRFLQNRRPLPKTAWIIGNHRLVHLMAVALPLTAAVQVWILVRFGGLWGYMQAFSDNFHAFDGMGWIFLVAETFPSLLAVFVLVYKRKVLKQAPWTAIALLMIAFFITKLIFGGLRGSRSNTILAMFWLCGAIHLWIKPVPRHLVTIGIAFLVAFMYLYGFYKEQGVTAFDALQNPEDVQATSHKTTRTLDTALLSDLARSELQAYVLYRVLSVGDYDYAAGSTYLNAPLVLIPKSIRPDWIPSKVEKGTEALVGRGTYSQAYQQASQVYGLSGEAMLNFSPWFAPLSFAGLAFSVVKTRRVLFSHPDDGRRLLLPFLVTACILVVNSDLDNMVFFFLASVLPVLAVIKLSAWVLSIQTGGHRSLLRSRSMGLPTIPMVSTSVVSEI